VFLAIQYTGKTFLLLLKTFLHSLHFLPTKYRRQYAIKNGDFKENNQQKHTYRNGTFKTPEASSRYCIEYGTQIGCKNSQEKINTIQGTMRTEHLRKIYSRHGLSNWTKTVDVLTGVEDILVDVFDQDQSSQAMFFDAMKKVLDTYKTKVHV
jgi:hypothetical protein